MKMKQSYQGHDRVSDKSQLQLLINRVSEKKAHTGTNRASHHAREPIEDDDERLAMRQSDMLPPKPERGQSENSRRPRSAGLPTELGNDAPCHLRKRLHKSMV